MTAEQGKRAVSAAPTADAHIVMNGADVDRALTRIAHEIVESNRGIRDLVLLGIPTRGVHLARRIQAAIESIEPGQKVPCGSLDVTMYRDDLARTRTRTPARTEVPVTLDGATVVLVDDVLYSGRTIRAALDALNDLGRPHIVKLAALIDRGHRQLPIRADFVGKNLPSAAEERINVRIKELDGEDYVAIEHGVPDSSQNRPELDAESRSGAIGATGETSAAAATDATGEVDRLDEPESQNRTPGEQEASLGRRESGKRESGKQEEPGARADRQAPGRHGVTRA